MRNTPSLVLESPCRIVDGRWLFFGKTVLDRNALRLVGWTRHGRYARTIALSDLSGVAWNAGDRLSPNLLLSLHNGEELALHIRGAALWRLTIDSMLKPAHALGGWRTNRRTYRHRVLYEWMPAAGDGAVPLSGDGAALTSPPVAVASQTPRT